MNVLVLPKSINSPINHLFPLARTVHEIITIQSMGTVIY
jgi:hypothetical protein